MILLSYKGVVLSQANERDSLISTPIFDENLKSINPEAERYISNKLKNMTLQEMVNKGIISRYEMEGLALPLGIHKKNTNIDFVSAMYDMWMSKAKNAQGRKGIIEASSMIAGIEAIEMMKTQIPSLSNIKIYRDSILSPTCDSMRQLHFEMQRLYSTDRRIFMDIIANNISANVLLSYNIQEMLPPTYMTSKRKIVDVNPIFKVHYLDRLFREAGYEFISYFPARYDGLHSLGPFQFTDIAFRDIKTNSRLLDKFKIFRKTTDLKNIENHALAAAFFAYNNWERMSYVLKSAGLLKNFNSYFADSETDSIKKRSLRIFIAGVTACMHHNPPQTFEAVKKYLQGTNDISQIHCSWMKKEDNKQLYKYYRSTAEAYLILKVYDKLFE